MDRELWFETKAHLHVFSCSYITVKTQITVKAVGGGIELNTAHNISLALFIFVSSMLY